MRLFALLIVWSILKMILIVLPNLPPLLPVL
jgi:hypothetical protein